MRQINNRVLNELVLPSFTVDFLLILNRKKRDLKVSFILGKLYHKNRKKSLEEELTDEIEKLEEKVESLNQKLKLSENELHRVNDCLTKHKNNDLLINHDLSARNNEIAALKKKVLLLEDETGKLKSRSKTQDQKLKDTVEEELKLQHRLRHQGNVIRNMKEKQPSSHNVEKQLLSDNKAQAETIEALQSEAEAYESSMKSYEASETNLKAIVATRESELVDQQQKFEKAGNPDFNNMNVLEASMKKQLSQIENNLKQSLLQEVRANNEKMDEKLNKLINRKAPSVEACTDGPGVNSTNTSERNERNGPTTGNSWSSVVYILLVHIILVYIVLVYILLVHILLVHILLVHILLVYILLI